MNDYYVYLYLREDNTPYYVGKGRGDRAFKKYGRRMKPPSDKSKIVFHTKNLTEEKAFELEKKLIAEYGRKDNGTGILRNLTDGGEGMSGHIFSDEWKKNQSDAMKVIMNKPEVKDKHRMAMKEVLSKPEVKAKMSAAAKEVHSRPEVKAKRYAAIKKTLSKPEVKAKISQNNGMKRPEVKAKISAARKEYYRKKREAEQASANTLTKFFSE